MIFTDWFTAIFVVVVVGGGLLVDVFLIRKGGEPNSISFRTSMWSMKYPMIPFMVGLVIGLLGGHLFWVNHAWCQP